jgi:F-type H+-transporting ATPase subunit b
MVSRTASPVSPAASGPRCERRYKAAHLVLAGAAILLLATGALEARWQPGDPARPADAAPGTADHGTPPAANAEHAEEAAAAHRSGALDLVARLVNFAILAGVLVYFLRSPIAIYLGDRADQVRRGLTEAAALRQSALAELERIEERMRALPGELAALKVRGTDEIAAERARIRQTADAERERLLDQARREIDLQVRAARRELVQHASDLAVRVAMARLEREMTPVDHRRLVDRYVEQLPRPS